MKKRVRIKDIANKAKVSTGTVDRVLHNRGNVAPEVKKRVLQVIEELGYERNILASVLAYNKTVRVASLLPRPENDLYWLQTNQGVLQAVKAVQHYGLIVEQFFFDYENPLSFVKTAEQLLKNSPDGILFPPIFSKESYWLMEQCEKNKIPYVIINTNLEGAKPLSYIGQDSYQSGVLGARLLNFGLSSEMAVCILNLDFSTKAAQHLISKESGFRDYFENTGNKEVEIIRKDFEEFNDPNALRTFLEELINEQSNLQGFFITNSRAFKIVECIGDLIKKRNIKVVGFDLIEPNLNYLEDNQISFLINQNPSQQGFKGIHCLFKHLIQGEEVKKFQYLPLDIIVKENANYHVQQQFSNLKVIL